MYNVELQNSILLLIFIYRKISSGKFSRTVRAFLFAVSELLRSHSFITLIHFLNKTYTPFHIHKTCASVFRFSSTAFPNAHTNNLLSVTGSKKWTGKKFSSILKTGKVMIKGKLYKVSGESDICSN